MIQTYLEDNEKNKQYLEVYMKEIRTYIGKLKSIGIDIKQLRWFQNFTDIYIPMFYSYIETCLKKRDFNEINKENDRWMRVEIKAFLSDVEKTTKWFIGLFYEEKKNINDTFYNSIKHLTSVPKDFPPLTDPNYNILEIFKNEHKSLMKCAENMWGWRNIYNILKHENRKEESHYVKGNTLFSLDGDITGYVSIHSQNILVFLKIFYRIRMNYNIKLKIKPRFYLYENNFSFLEEKEY